MDEPVIGVVLEKHAENFNVDIGGPFPAALSVLAFEVSPAAPFAEITGELCRACTTVIGIDRRDVMPRLMVFTKQYHG